MIINCKFAYYSHIIFTDYMWKQVWPTI